jgi:uncharacterized RDD family membrane protein YckC
MTPSASPESNAAETKDQIAAAPASTLIEFPTPGRAPRPQWRKELSERVREIQQRKAQEAAREAEAAAQETALFTPQTDVQPNADAQATTQAAAIKEPIAPPLGLVPPAPAPEMHQLAVKALKRIERARQQSPAPPARAPRRGHGAATAAARVVREEYQTAFEAAPQAAQPAAQPAIDLAFEPAPQPAPRADQSADVQQATLATSAPTSQTPAPVAQTEQPLEVEPALETARPRNLVVVSAQAPTQTETADTETDAREKSRRHIPVVLDDAYLARREAAEVAAQAPPAPQPAAPAPLLKRAFGGLIDLLVVAFAASPFAAIIELTNGNWSDPRVAGSLGGIVCVLMFLYLMASTALAGRTWGLSLVALRTVDAGTGRAPTTGQCVRRALGYMLALATGGLGLIYALFDSRGRALQDHLSGTIIVRE